MSDALVSPAVGGAMWAASAGLSAVAVRRVERDRDDRRVPLMGVLGSFVFAAQMINFSIPGTGSSGHLGGGLLLSILLGPGAGFVVMASVLTVQALFFADGGLLALGCNLFNLGFFTCFVAYPLLWRPIARLTPGETGRTDRPSRTRLAVASVVAGVVGLQLGALGVVVETALSGVSTLPTASFLALMLPIHLAVGVVEGLVTAAVILAVWQARPDVVDPGARRAASLRPVVAGLAVAAILTGAIFSLFASAQPDGLEWSVAKAGGAVAAPATGVHEAVARVQGATAVLPDYAFKGQGAGRAGTSAAGLLGGALVLAIGAGAGAGLRAVRRRAQRR